jgi:CRP/FNR family transcriptional regulator
MSTLGTGPLTVKEALRSCYFFDALSDDEAEALASATRLVRYEAREMIFGEGDPADHFFVVLSGTVQIFKLSAEGKEMILHLFQPGDIVAEFPIFGGIPKYPANALCLENTQVLAINGKQFKQIVSTKSDILLKMLARFSQRLKEFNTLIEDLSLRSVDARLAKYLLSISQNSPSQAEIDVQKKTLAAILGTVPETLSRAFKRLSADGVIQLKDTHIHILNRDKLRVFADAE